MPKLKTSSSAKKRFLVGGSGRIKRGQAFKSHLTAKRSPKRIRQLRGYAEISSANMNLVRGMLPYAAKKG